MLRASASGGNDQHDTCCSPSELRIHEVPRRLQTSISALRHERFQASYECMLCSVSSPMRQGAFPPEEAIDTIAPKAAMFGFVVLARHPRAIALQGFLSDANPPTPFPEGPKTS